LRAAAVGVGGLVEQRTPVAAVQACRDAAADQSADVTDVPDAASPARDALADASPQPTPSRFATGRRPPVVLQGVL